ncbi:MAG: sialidase family protein [Ilumatobacteraceae bacterium]
MIAAAVVASGVLVALVATRSDGGGSNDPIAQSASGGLTGGDFYSIAVDPSNPDRIFVGGHQAVSESTDAGATWSEIPALRDADAMGWAFTNDNVYVSGHPGLTVSVDQAGSFELVNDGLPDTDLHALGGTDDVLYAAGPGVGVSARTETDGQWEQRTAQAGQSFFGRILVDPTEPDVLIAADAANGVAASADGGRTWQLLPSGLASATWISRSGPDGQTIVASGGAGAALSSDGGTTWEPLQLPPGASLVELSPDDADTMYAGIHDGDRVRVSTSSDAGRTWSDS